MMVTHEIPWRRRLSYDPLRDSNDAENLAQEHTHGAKLRELKTDDNTLLFHTNMDAGHGGQSGRFRRYKEVALEYAFMMDLEGITE